MTITRDDISFDGNVARRLFWEKCASRQPQIYEHSEGVATGATYNMIEDSEDVAQWADRMLNEWDKRWIAEEVNSQT